MPSTGKISDGDSLAPIPIDLIDEFFDISPALLAVVGGDTRILKVNPGWTTTLGWKPEELVGKLWSEFLHAESLATDTAAFCECLKSPGVSTTSSKPAPSVPHLECRFRSAGGDYRWINWNLRVSSDPRRILAAGLDVTDHRHAEDQARNSARDLALVVNAAPIALFAADRTGLITQFAGRLGQSEPSFHPREWIGSNGFIIFAHHAQVIENWKRVLKGESFVDMVAWGGEEWETHYTPLQTASGEVSGLVGVAWNVSARRRAEAQLLELQQRFAQVSRVAGMGGMLAAIAHELNQPLGAIANYASGAAIHLERLPPDSLRSAGIVATLNAVKTIQNEALRAGEIVRRLRSLMQRRVVSTRPEKLVDILKEIQPLIDAAVKNSRARLEIDLDENLPTIDCDRVQLQQVILNLIQNGLDAMENSPPPRTLRIVARPGRPGFVAVSIIDRGCGLDPKVADKVFETFVTTKPSGVGLGLAVSREIVESCGGSIRLQNNPDGGTRAELELPEQHDEGQRSRR